MSSIISVNDLHKSDEPRLIFQANDIFQKGLSSKSYSIVLANDKYNNSVLGNIFGQRFRRSIVFDAMYTVSGVEMVGKLKVTEITDRDARAVFISGNGSLWAEMEGKRLADIDWSDEDIVLTKDNVINSESGLPFVCFDLMDRGEFKNADMIDLTDRYPSINVKQMLSKIATAFGSYATFEEISLSLSDLYLIFTQSHELRNDSDWEKSALFTSKIVSAQSYDTTVTGAPGTLVIDEQIPLPETLDNGLNYDPTTGEYTVPDTGTYNFVSNYNVRLRTVIGSTITSPSFVMSIKRNGTTIFEHTQTPDFSTSPNDILTGSLNTRYIELTAGDVITIHAYFEAGTDADGKYYIDVYETTFENKVSRWYGVGSTISISSILPDMDIKEFLGKLFSYLNIDPFFDEHTRVLLLRTGLIQDVSGSVQCWDFGERIEEQTNVILKYASDKMLATANDYIITGNYNDSSINFDFSKTYFGTCFRLFKDTETKIPVLWASGDPSKFDQIYTPPKHQTAGNLRVMRKGDATTPVSKTYAYTFGGDTTTNSASRLTVLQFYDIDTRSLHLTNATLENVTVTFNARLELAKLYDLTYFKSPLRITNRRTGSVLGNFKILMAEQLGGDVFRVMALSTATVEVLELTTTIGGSESSSVGASVNNGGGSTFVLSTASNPLYIGDSSTEGAWRFYDNGTNLLVQRLESLIWVTKQTISK